MKFFRKLKQNLKSLMFFLGIRKYYIRFIVYNKTIMRVLSVINYYRWQNIDLVIILWPTAFPFFDEINKDIAKLHDIETYEIIKIHENKFEEFIYKLYDIDFANPRKVALKMDLLLSSPSYTLGIVKIRIKKPQMVVQDALNRVRCDSVGDLKDSIRRKYMDRIPEYIYDVVIHSTEVDYQNKKVIKLLKKYSTTT